MYGEIVPLKVHGNGFESGYEIGCQLCGPRFLGYEVEPRRRDCPARLEA